MESSGDSSTIFNPFRAAGTFTGISYIEREADQHLRAAIEQNDRYPYVLAARQSGKSSLLVHTAQALDPEHFHIVFIDLSTFSDNALNDYDAFLTEISARLMSQSGSTLLTEYTGRSENALDFSQAIMYLLQRHAPRRVLLFLDEIDVLVGVRFRDNFLSLVRSLFNERAWKRYLERLQFILAGAATPDQLIQDHNRSPFNIGVEIRLDELTLNNIHFMLGYFDRRGMTINHKTAAHLLDQTGGSVYLTQAILESMWKQKADDSQVLTIDDVEKAAQRLIENAQGNLHFRNIYSLLHRELAVLRAWQDLSDEKAIDSEAQERLRLVGISDGRRPFHNEIYRRVFGSGGPLDLLNSFDPKPASLAGTQQTRLAGPDLERLQNAIATAYDASSLEQMLRFKLDHRLDEITASNASFRDVVYDLLTLAESEGWLRELIVKAAGTQSGNTALVAVCLDLLEKWPESSSVPSGPEVNSSRKRRINVPERNTFFTGREAQLQQLQELLSQSETAAVTQKHAISGLGGVGKTALAVEFAHRFEDAYEYILFCSADGVDALNTGYEQIARELDLPEKEAKETEVVVQGVRAWLEGQSNWLLILDYGDCSEMFTAEMLHAYLPDPARGHVLFITRSLVFHGSLNIRETNVVHLDVLLPKDAIRFLIDRSGKTAKSPSTLERAAITTLAAELGYLPLALEQAAAYIAAQQTTFQNYLPLYQELLHKQAPETGDYPKTVRTTWQINFDRAEKESKAAIEILEVLALLAPEAIPAEVITKNPSAIGPKTKQAFRAALKTNDSARMRLVYDQVLEPLVRYSLITKSPNDGELNIHRLVQAVVRDRWDERRRYQATERAIGALKGVFPAVEFGHWDQCERLLPHARMVVQWIEKNRVQTVDAALLLNQTGLCLDERRLYQEAEPLYRKALAMHRSYFPFFPMQHPDVANSLNNLAKLYQDQGRFEDALPLYESALAIRRSLSSLGRLFILEILRALFSLGRLSILELLRASLPARYPSIVNSLNNLALLYRDINRDPHRDRNKDLERFEKAQELFKEALSIYRSSLSAKHPHSVTTLNNLALLYQDQERFEEALPLYQEALEIYRSSPPSPLSKKHPNIASCLYNLARLHHSQGHLDDALPLYQEALAIRRATLPKDHPDIASSLSNLAALYYAQNRLREAEHLFVEALEIATSALGVEHPTTRAYAQKLESVRKPVERDDDIGPLFTSKPELS